MAGVANDIRAAAAAGLGYYVHGPINLYVGESLPPSPAVDTLKPLGVTTEGIGVKFTIVETMIETDAAGKGVPAEFALQGVTADLSFKLGTYDPVQLEELLRRATGQKGAAANAPFESGGPGRLVASGGFAFRLVIDHPVLPIRFLCCKLRGDLSKLLSTDFTKPDLRVFAWEFTPGGYLTKGPDAARTGTDAPGVRLYDHTAT